MKGRITGWWFRREGRRSLTMENRVLVCWQGGTVCTGNKGNVCKGKIIVLEADSADYEGKVSGGWFKKPNLYKFVEYRVFVCWQGGTGARGE